MVRNGKPVDSSYGCIAAKQLDPIEKKPLYHFLPGCMVYSIGGYGCNFRCAFCQNWHIAQSAPVKTTPTAPETIISEALRYKASGIAFTYNEPIISLPFVVDTATLAQKADLRTILVTNGYIQTQPAVALLEVIDAVNLDIKSMDDAFYRNQCGAKLDPVLAFARQAKESGVHLEITNLLIPEQNDAPHQVTKLAQWIAQNLTPETVLHLSAYHPAYRSDIAPTTTLSVIEAQKISQHHLAHVYCGNIPYNTRAQDTFCRKCGNILIVRKHQPVHVVGLTRAGTCRQCGSPSTVYLANEVSGAN